MLADVLKFIITGIPHSGTTPLSDVFRNVPGLFSSFECGFLLHKTPEEFVSPTSRYHNIYYDSLKHYWKLTDDDVAYITSTDKWEDVYRRLRQQSTVVVDKNVSLFDKTPHYIYYLDEVMQRAGNVPIIIIIKDIRLQYFSLKRRNAHNILDFLNILTDEFAEKLLRLRDSGRIHIVKYEDMCLYQQDEFKKIFEFIGIEFNTNYLHFTSRYQPQYGTGIETKYLTAYKGKLNDDELNAISSLVTHPLFYYDSEIDIEPYGQTGRPSIYSISTFQKHRDDAYQMLTGRGLEVGALNQAAITNDTCVIGYCDVISHEEAAELFDEHKKENFVEVQHICDLNTNGLSMFKDGEFDFVILNHVIEHVANPIRIIGELFRIIRRGGKVIISTFDKNFTHINMLPSTDITQLIHKYNNNINEISDEQYMDLLHRVHPEVFEKGDEAITAALERARRRREHIYFWDSNAFKEFLQRSFKLLAIEALCVYESTGFDNGNEYFAMWEKVSY